MANSSATTHTITCEMFDKFPGEGSGGRGWLGCRLRIDGAILPKNERGIVHHIKPINKDPCKPHTENWHLKMLIDL